MWLLFKQKLVGDGLEREKIQIIVSFRSYPTPTRKFPINSKKIHKIRRIPFWLHFKQKLVEKCQEREKIKIIVLHRSYMTRNRKFQKKSKKIQKIIKYYYGFISSQNKWGNAEKERK